jgi:hypothetical protein
MPDSKSTAIESCGNQVFAIGPATPYQKSSTPLVILPLASSYSQIDENDKISVLTSNLESLVPNQEGMISHHQGSLSCRIQELLERKQRVLELDRIERERKQLIQELASLEAAQSKEK